MKEVKSVANAVASCLSGCFAFGKCVAFCSAIWAGESGSMAERQEVREMNVTSDLLRAMGIGDILDGAIRLYKGNFLLLIRISAWVYIPFCFLALVIPQSVFSFSIRIISIFLAAVVTVAISERILNREISVIDAYRRVSKRLFSFIVAMLLVGLVGLIVFLGVGILSAIWFFLLSAARLPTALGYLTLVLVSLFTLAMIVWLLFVPQAVVLEGSEAARSIGRSVELIKGNFWRTLVILILVSIAMFLISFLFGLVGGAIVAILSDEVGTTSAFTEGVTRFQRFPLVIGVVNLLLEPFRMAVITLLYYDIRVRKEGYDLEVMAKELAVEEGAKR
jgi:hypothetical protein